MSTRRRSGSRMLAIAGAVAVLSLTAFGHAALAEGPWTITVDLDRAKLVDLPKGLNQIILGNPIIVGITPLPGGGGAVLTGKAFGETNMIVLDDKGAVVLDALIRIGSPSATDLVVQRGQQRASYDCPSGCELRSQLGDVGEAAQDAGTQIQTRNGLAQPTSSTPSAKGGGAL
jgi:hypothetical protein